ncbi:MAG: hypothetical protein M3N47_12315 [Chloroflexota bacterium]|nr:hypothetical protein [Chloroflexota bacterium]
MLLCALVAAACAPAAIAPIAAAQEDEVFVDPGSPSGKEYELPIDRARQQGAKSATRGSSAQKAPLFGEGVERNDAGAAPPASKDVDRTKESERSTSRERRKAREQARKAEAASQAEAQEAQEEAREAELARVRALRAQAAAAPDGGIGVGGIVGAGVGVLLVGGLIGLWLRRRTTT